MSIVRGRARLLSVVLGSTLLAACAAPTHTVQTAADLPPIPGLTVAGAEDWLLSHTIGCEQVSQDWERPQRWQCDADKRDVGEGTLAVSIIGDDSRVFRVEAVVSDIPRRFDPDDYAASFFWNLMGLPFAGHADTELGRGAPDPAGVTDQVRVSGKTTFAGLLFDYGRRGSARTLFITPES
jgi:hypothetical protein